MKAVAYYRVSTAGQGRSGLGLAAQKAAVDELAGQRRLNILAEFTEVESGKRNDRPKLAEAFHHAKVTGAVLVIAKLDRLSRNAAFLLTLRDSGVRFLAADIPDANDLTIGVLAVVAQAEREAISKRTSEALAAIKRQLASGGSHTSRRSGRTVHRLGNPNGTQAARQAGTGSRLGVEANAAAAARRAADLAPVVAALISSGIVSLTALATAMNIGGILTPRGRRWHPSSVRNLILRLKQTS